MTAAERRAALAERVVDRLRDLQPRLHPATARQAVTQAGKTVPSLQGLLDHLREHPEALVSGSPAAPPSLVRLVHALISADVVGLRPPGCAGCGKTTADLRGYGGLGLVCQSCYKDARRQACVRCGTVARVAAREQDGPVCNACYLRDPRRHEPCAGCGQTRRIAYRDGEGRPWCAPCYPRPQRICVGCGQSGPATAITEAGPVCPRCYAKPRRRCGRCQRMRAISRRATSLSPDLCYSCDHGRIALCSACGQQRPSKGLREGQPICARCYVQPSVRCDFCGDLGPVTARWQIGVACPSCYVRIRAQPVECPGCGQPRVLTTVDSAGRRQCAECGGGAPDPTCLRCGGRADGLVRDRCSRCAVTERVDQLLARPAGDVATPLQPIRDLLCQADNPRSVLAWLGRSNGARLLSGLAQHDGPLTHEILDGYPRSRFRNHIRQALVRAGALPERHEPIEHVEAWLDDLLRHQVHQHIQLVRPYAHWVVLRRARRRARQRPTTEGSASWARARIRSALDLLTWLHEQDLDLARLDQPTLDRWLAEGRTPRYTVHDFLVWARRQRLVGPIQVPRRQPRAPEATLAEDERWSQLRRCLHDPVLPLRLRAAGALLLLYGQPVSRIVQITASQLADIDRGSYLTLDRHPMILPPALAALIHELQRTATPKAILGGRGQQTTWLFPGQVPGQHITSNYLVKLLNGHGIHARSSRNAALISLAADLPAAVLADLLGLHPNTAVRWVRRSKRDWASYLAARAADQPDTATLTASDQPSSQDRAQRRNTATSE